MKDCPKCGTVYTDDTLSFCLSDGTQLVAQMTGEKTEKFSNLVVDINTNDKTSIETKKTNLPTQETFIRNNQTNDRKGVSPFWLFATFGLLGIFVIGGISYWYLSTKTKNIESKTNQTVKENNTNRENSISKDDPKTEKSAKTTQTPKPKTYQVAGVKNNDVLNMRPKAGNLKVIVGKIPPNGKGIKLIGGRKRVGKSTWLLISYKGKKGWVNSKFIAKE